MSLRIGSLCSGYRGLDMAVEDVFGGTTAWVSDIDPGASKILAHHWPTVPNLGDLTAVDWSSVEPVDIVLGGYPCQPFSNAGKRKGTADERHIWPWIARALGVLRPRYAIFENVGGHLRLGFDTVLTDLAGLGFDVEWCVVRASEVGAPHQRRRLIILATAADAPHLGHERAGAARGRGHGPADHGDPAADGKGTGLEGPRLPGRSPVNGATPADAARLGRGEGRPEPEGQQGGSGVAVSRGTAPADTSSLVAEHGELPAGRDSLRRGLRDDAPRCGAPAPAHPDSSGQRPHVVDLRKREPDAAWGAFLPAVRRWERASGRHAPRAVDVRNRLSPPFVEWLMGLPDGHVTAVPDLTRTQQLHALGNGVVPQQATAALRLLLNRSRQGVAACQPA